LRRFRVPEIAIGFGLGIVFFLFVAAVASYQTEHCRQYQESSSEKPPTDQEIKAPPNDSGRRDSKPSKDNGEHLQVSCGIGGIVPSVLDFMDQNEGFFVGLFTGLLVIVTGFLWGATNQLWRAGERGLATTERAFVFIDGFNYELSTRADDREPLEFSEAEPGWHRSHPELVITRFAIQPRWKNGGNTPTRKMTIQVDWRGPPYAILEPRYVYRMPPRSFFLAPRAAEPGAVIDIPSAPALINWAMNPVHEAPEILIWGRADYEDVFGGTHFIEWCYQLRFSRPIRKERMTAQFIPWGTYNRSDES